MSTAVTSFSTAFIGAGNMAFSMIGGLIDAGTDPALLRASDRSEAQLQRLRELGVCVLDTETQRVARDADVVVLAV